MNYSSRLIPLFLFVSLSLLGPSLRAEDVIYLAATETEELEAKEGQKVTVYGLTDGSGKSSSGTNFVNFKGADFYLVTFKSDLDQFEEGEPSDLYDGKRIAVSGVMSVYQGKPQFKLTSPEQIAILAEGEEFPPPEASAPKTNSAEKAAPAKKESEEKKAAPEEPKKKPPVDPKKYFK